MREPSVYPLLIAGVTGSRKSTIAGAWSSEYGSRLIEGDLFHSRESIAKMRAGVALEDARWRTRAAAALFAACLSLSPSLAGATDEGTAVGEPRTRLPLETGWRVSAAPQSAGVQAPGFDDSGWERVSIPHTWNRVGNEGTERSPLTNADRSIGWYRLRFKAPAMRARGRTFLEFDAVATVADVWLNGDHLCQHRGAFTRFRCDASASLRQAGDNVLVVEADNSRPAPGSSTENVIPLSGDFVVFGGIYRGVALLSTGQVHIDLEDFGGPGVYARTVSIGEAHAVIAVTARLVNEGPSARRIAVDTRIEDASGVPVASDRRGLHLSAGVGRTATFTMRIPRPRLWRGTIDPYLYAVVVTLRDSRGSAVDRVRQPLGVRSMRFDPDEGFFLNGEHRVLRGVSVHQDRPVKGWAVSRADRDEDFRIIAELGANAVRFAHYPHDDYAYELADRQGLVAWAEIPLVNQVSFDGSPASPALTANARQQLTELIRQNYNHPSIAVWSIANEVDLVAAQRHERSAAAPLLGSLNALAKSEDPDRPTTLADCCEAVNPSDEARRQAIVGVTDTVGYNRYFGWYYGDIAQLGPMLDAAHARHPRLPLAVSEYGAGGALTQHTDEPMLGRIQAHGRPHPEEIESAFHERSWEQLRSRSYLWGTFVWNLFDFASDSRREGDLTDINDKGLVSYDRRIRKDAFYFYRANWSAQPTLHLASRRYTERPRAIIDVTAYSNAERAALWVNDAAQGETSCSVGICVWHGVHLSPGVNRVRAEADIAGAKVIDELRWELKGTAP